MVVVDPGPFQEATPVDELLEDDDLVLGGSGSGSDITIGQGLAEAAAECPERIAMIAGTEQPNPISMGMKLRPCRPMAFMTRSIR